MTKTDRVRALLARPIAWPCPRPAVECVASEEDCRLTAYLDDVGVPTNGWGETDGVQLGQVWTQEYADERLRQALSTWTDGVRLALGGVPASDNQLSAMISLSYNVGLPAFRTSTVLRLHRAGDFAGAARAFLLWDKVTVNGRKVRNAGLAARRAREMALYSTPDAFEGTSVQAVSGEPRLRTSPTMVAGAGTTALGLLAGAQSVTDQALPVIAQVQSFSEAFGVKPLTLLAVALVVVGAVVAWRRWKQRQEGVA